MTDQLEHVSGTSLHQVSDGIYAFLQHDGTWWINNTGFFVGSRGVVSVDACATERRTMQYLDTLRSVSAQPVRTLINTHHHGDHTFGNYLFPGASIIAHERAREAMRAWGPPNSDPFWTPIDWGSVELDYPFVTFTDSVTVWIDDLRVEVRYIGTAAHTTNDSIVWTPERGVLFCGDLMFNGGTPFLLQGSVIGAIDTLETFIRPLGARVIIPGHGPVAGPELIDTTLGYLTFVKTTAEQGLANGLSPLEMAREVDLREYADWADSERLVGNLHRAYAELGGAERGAQIDLFAALTDMVVFNGGRPLESHA